MNGSSRRFPEPEMVICPPPILDPEESEEGRFHVAMVCFIIYIRHDFVDVNVLCLL